MAALFAILNALRRAVQRDLGTFRSIAVNNFFLFVALMIYSALNTGLEPKSAEPLLLLLGFLLLFPISSDPLERIPPSRLALWPLSTRQRIGLRLTSFLLSPVIWIVFLIMLRRAVAAISFLAAAIVVQSLVVLGGAAAKREPHWNVLRRVPQFPGRLGGMIRNNVRQILSILDTYVAALLAIGGGLYRFASPHPDPAAYPILSVLVALALSTYTQSLFGMDRGSGETRYRLLPLSGWQILLAKGIAFLGVLLLLLLPLDIGPGLTFGFVALAFGHHPSVFLRLPQRRWRFTGGRVLPVGLLQGVGGIALGLGEHQRGVLVLVFAAAAYLFSVYWYGRCWDRQSSYYFSRAIAPSTPSTTLR